MALFRVTYDATLRFAIPLDELLGHSSLVVEVEAESFEEAEDLAGPIADNADEDLMHLGDGKLLPHGVIVTVLTKYSTRNLETDEELLH